MFRIRALQLNNLGKCHFIAQFLLNFNMNNFSFPLIYQGNARPRTSSRQRNWLKKALSKYIALQRDAKGVN